MRSARNELCHRLPSTSWSYCEERFPSPWPDAFAARTEASAHSGAQSDRITAHAMPKARAGGRPSNAAIKFGFP